jgi:hypothetical protein
MNGTNTDITELEINGIKYVRKDSIQARPELNKDNAVIVRCRSAGVFFGELYSHDKVTGTAVLKNARRCWYWSGAASLSQLAVDGTSKPGECKFPVAVPEIALAEVIEVIPCTFTAIKSLTSVKVWKQ